MKQLYIKFIVALPILCFFTLQVNAQAEVPNPTFPFWKVNGNSGTVDGTNFIGTTDAVPFNIRVNNQRAGRIDSALANTTFGFMAGRDLGALTGGNSLFGQYAGANMAVDAYTNAAFGYNALVGLNTGIDNVAIGRDAMAVLNSGNENVAVGGYALFSNTASGNTAIGHAALFANQSETFNTAVGYSALTSNRGSNNTGVGYMSLVNNFAGQHNTAMGADALLGNTSGYSNTAVGYVAGRLNSVGRRNTFLGDSADVTSNNLTNATAIGWNARVSQSNSMVLGSVAGVNGANTNVKVAIGNNAPNTSLDVKGDLALRERVLTLASGTNNNVAVDSNSFFRITGPLSNFALTGLAGGVDGKIVTLFNNTAHFMIVNSLALSLPANQILTGAGFLSVADSGTVTMQYNSTIAKWVVVSYNNASYGATGWNLTGNAGTNPATNFMGTTDNQDVVFKRNGFQAGLLNTTNTAWGDRALITNSTGNNNTTVGSFSLDANNTGSNNSGLGVNALTSNTSGGFNVAVGKSALNNNSDGNSNVAVGVEALFNNTIRSNLVAIGDSALYNNGVGVLSPIDAIQNVAVGSKALFTNTRGTANTAVGFNALRFNSTGTGNTALGSNALISNTLGGGNTALGFRALDANTTGSNNSAVGLEALNANTTGFSNVAVGNSALLSNTTRSNLVAVGDSALYNNGVGVLSVVEGIENTAVGSKAGYANSRGSSNTALGSSALRFNTTGSGNVAVGTYSLEYIIGTNNTAVGFNSGLNHISNSSSTFIGANADDLVGSLFNVAAIGANAKVSQQNNIIFGDTVNRPKIGIGVTAVGKTLSGTLFEVASEGANDNLLFRYSGAQTPTLNFQRSIGTLAAPTAVVSGSTLGRLDFYGYDGTNWDQAAVISTESDSAVSAGIVPSRIRFLTQNSGVGVIERMRINRNGNVIIGDGFDRNTLLYLDGGMTIEPYNLIVALTGDNQLVNVGNESYIRLTSNTTVGTSRTVYLGNGLEVGQLLIISSVSAGTNQFELVDVDNDPATNTETGLTSLLMDPKDTATFIWDGTDWLMLSFRSNN